ncbi:hypothetical protein FK004_17735 [Flavobacterium kingsejongi]|uniref:HTH luxR-type domain-containing protein n=2 Tax=Flavobacterium kingsejongi TaxID=1678728 RepID=A0A2S1LUF4_9FLAO|nr:hypothetical protein FK004_17735 [Flavobacterium kingsejongi]
MDATLESLELELNIHKKLLSIFQVGDFYYFIFNVAEANFEFISAEVGSVLGYDPNTITANEFLENIHLEDQPYFLNFENCLNVFFRKLQPNQIENYKVCYDFRVKNKNGKYVRILHQLVALQYDESYNITRTLGIHTDISHLKTNGIPVLSFIGLNDEPSFINVKPEMIYLPVKEFFSKREKQILKYLCEGKNSSEISIALYISKFTVDTHRKNMLMKTNTRSAVALVMKSLHEGWI